MASTPLSPTGARSPTTPVSSMSSVRAMVSRLERSGSIEKETKKTPVRIPGKISTGRVAATDIQTPSPPSRPRDVQQPPPLITKLSSDTKTTERTTSPKLIKPPGGWPENLSEDVQTAVPETPNEALGEEPKEASVKPIISEASERTEKIELAQAKTRLKPISPPSPLSPSIPYSQTTHTLFPRNVSPVQRASSSSASMPLLSSDGPPSTPSTPSWRRRNFGEEYRVDRSSLVSVSPSMPATGSSPISPISPKTPTTPVRLSTANYNETTPEDYSLTLLRYKAYFERPLARYLDGNDYMIEGGIIGNEHDGGKAGEHGHGATMDEQLVSFPRRQRKDVDAFWGPVRQYLLITDEELYE